jgi:hypothetical protein
VAFVRYFIGRLHYADTIAGPISRLAIAYGIVMKYFLSVCTRIDARLLFLLEYMYYKHD